jgi:hypothetical protein
MSLLPLYALSLKVLEWKSNEGGLKSGFEECLLVTKCLVDVRVNGDCRAFLYVLSLMKISLTDRSRKRHVTRAGQDEFLALSMCSLRRHEVRCCLLLVCMLSVQWRR